MVIGGLGLVGLFWTWKETRRTANAAFHAVEETREANRIARDTAQRQLRAYVNVTRVGMLPFEAGKVPAFLVEMLNTGQTPAKHLMLVSQPFPRAATQKRAYIRFKRLTGEGSRLVLAPNKPWPHFNPMLSPLNEEQVTNFASGVFKMCFAGVISYRDIFGKRHLTTFKAEYDPKTATVEDGIVNFSVCKDGNYSN